MMVSDRDSEQDRMIRDNAERIARNEKEIERQTEALEKIRDHFYPPPKRAWRKALGFLAKACCAVFAYLGIAETVDWIWNARESGSLAARYAEIAERLLGGEGDAATAMTCYERAIKLDPKESEYVMAHAYVKGLSLADEFLGVARPLTDGERARLAAARGEATVLRELEPDNPMSHVLMAQVLTFEGERQEAVRAIERAVACAPERASVRVSACAINFFAGRYEEARRHLAEAERIDSSLPLVACWRSVIALSVDRNAAEAKKWAEESVRRCPRSSRIHVQLGRSILAGEKPDLAAARAAFRRALALDAKCDAAKLGMAETYEREGNLRVARLWLERALEGDSRQLPAFLARARVNLGLGDTNAAVGDLTAAISISPFRAELYRLRADARAKAGDADGEREDRATADALGKADLL